MNKNNSKSWQNILHHKIKKNNDTDYLSGSKFFFLKKKANKGHLMCVANIDTVYITANTIEQQVQWKGWGEEFKIQTPTSTWLQKGTFIDWKSSTASVGIFNH